MRLQSIVNTNDALEIGFVREEDVDIDAGVIESRVVRIAHEALPQEFMEELETLVVQILDEARRKRFGVAEEFKVKR